MTMAYLGMLVCYGFSFSDDSDGRMGYLIALTVLFAAIAWVCSYVDYRIEKLRRELAEKDPGTPR